MPNTLYDQVCKVIRIRGDGRATVLARYARICFAKKGLTFPLLNLHYVTINWIR